MEIWKPVKNYESLYEVSNYGRVRSLPRKPYRKKVIIMSPGIAGEGYLSINLYKKGQAKKQYVHRLVAEAFIENPHNYPEINHKDEIRTNNAVDNLEWCTSKYNKNYGNRNRKMSAVKIGRFCDENAVKRSPVICIETGKYYSTMRLAALDSGASYTKITECCKGRRQKTGGYHWRYATEIEINEKEGKT